MGVVLLWCLRVPFGAGTDVGFGRFMKWETGFCRGGWEHCDFKIGLTCMIPSVRKTYMKPGYHWTIS